MICAGFASATASASELRVVGVSPQGVVDDPSPNICVVFDRQLRAEDGPGADSLRVEPAIESTRFVRTTDRICVGARWLRSGTRYRVRFAGPVVARDGSVYAGEELVWSFETPRPEVWMYDPIGPLARDEGVTIDTSADISLGELRRRVRAYAHPLRQERDFSEPEADDASLDARVTAARRGRPIAVEVARSDPDNSDAIVVRGRGGWPAGMRIAVIVEAGVRARSGPLGSLRPVLQEFASAAPQHVVGESCEDRSACEIRPLVLSMWTRLSELGEPVSVEPAPEGLRILEVHDRLIIEGAFVAGQTYTVKIPGEQAPIVRRYTFTRRPGVELSVRAAILEPGRPRTIGVTSRHLDRIAVRVARLGDADARALWVRAGRDEALPWPDGLVAAVDREFAVKPTGVNEWADTTLDLQDLVGDVRGAVLVEARGISAVGGGDSRMLPPARAVVQVTDLSAIAMVTPYRSILEVVRIGGGSAARGVVVEGYGTSDERGIVELTAGRRMGSGPEVVVLAEATTGDRAYVSLPAADVVDRVIGSIKTTRGLGRPGESISILGWTAVDTPTVASGLRRLPPGTAIEVSLTVRDGREVARARAQTDADGVFMATLEIPDGAKPGEHWIHARVARTGRRFADRGLWVANYELPGPHIRVAPLPGNVDTSRVALRVEYRDEFGAPGAGGSLEVWQSCRQVRMRPPGIERRWQIGVDVPDRGHGYGEVVKIRDDVWQPDLSAVFEVERGQDVWPRRCHASVRMWESFAAETAYVVHPSAYLAIAAPTRLRAGVEAAISVRAFTPTGKRASVSGVEVKVLHRGFTDYPGTYEDLWPLTPRCTLDVPSTGADAQCSLGPLAPGRYLVSAEGGRGGESEASFVVAASVPTAPPAGVRPEQLTVVADRWARPGDVRAVRVVAPWDAGPGLLWVDRGGLLAALPFVLRSGEAVVQLTAADSWVPGVSIGAAAVRPATADAPARLEHDVAAIEVSSEVRRLAVEVEAAEVVAAGSKIRVRVRVRDDQGHSVGGRIDAWMIDEAELTLANNRLDHRVLLPSAREAATPVAALATASPPFVARTRDLVAYTGPTRDGLVGRGGGGGTGGRWYPDRYLRRPFVVGPPPVVGVRLDAAGECTLELALPGEPTAFRLFVVATAGPGRSGQAQVTMHSVVGAAGR